MQIWREPLSNVTVAGVGSGSASGTTNFNCGRGIAKVGGWLSVGYLYIQHGRKKLPYDIPTSSRPMYIQAGLVLFAVAVLALNFATALLLYKQTTPPTKTGVACATNNEVYTQYFLYSEYLIHRCLDLVSFGTYICRGGYLHGLSCLNSV